MIVSRPLLSKKANNFFRSTNFFGSRLNVFSQFKGGRTSRDKDFRIKLTAFRSPKTQYYCDQILSKTDQDT